MSGRRDPTRPDLPDVTYSRYGQWRDSPLGGDYVDAGPLTRLEVERLLTLRELSAAVVQACSGLQEWVTPAEALRLWQEVSPYLDDVEPWCPPPNAPGALAFVAHLWKSPSTGHHVLVFIEGG